MCCTVKTFVPIVIEVVVPIVKRDWNDTTSWTIEKEIWLAESKKLLAWTKLNSRQLLKNDNDDVIDLFILI